MWGAAAGLAGLLALAGAPARAADFVPATTVMLFAPGSAEIDAAARDALLGFLRPPRPPLFHGQCVVAHADRGAGAAALSRRRAEAVAGMMTRQGVDRADIELLVQGDAVPAKLAPPGRAEPMNDRVELTPCPGPRLAGSTEAEARALDAAVVPGYVAGLAPRLARALGCRPPELPRGALEVQQPDCPAEVSPAAIPEVTVRRIEGTRRVVVVLDWPAGLGGTEDRPAALAAAGAVLDLFGIAAAPVLASLTSDPGPEGRAEFAASGARAEVEAGPGPVRRLRVFPSGGEP